MPCSRLWESILILSDEHDTHFRNLTVKFIRSRCAASRQTEERTVDPEGIGSNRLRTPTHPKNASFESDSQPIRGERGAISKA